jgi:hypothetical protein
MSLHSVADTVAAEAGLTDPQPGRAQWSIGYLRVTFGEEGGGGIDGGVALDHGGSFGYDLSGARKSNADGDPYLQLI